MGACQVLSLKIDVVKIPKFGTASLFSLSLNFVSCLSVDLPRRLRDKHAGRLDD